MKSFITVMSAPAMKARPAPVMMTTRIGVVFFYPTSKSLAYLGDHLRAFMALRALGRLMVTKAKGPSVSYNIVS